MAFKSKPSKIGLSDPGVERSVQGTLNQQSIIANGSPTIESGPRVVLPNSTLRTTATTVGVLTSANNQPGDTVTIYSGANSIYVSAIDQTVKSFIINGVTQILPGDNISITPSDGTGVVTISANASLNVTKIENGNSYANIANTSGNLVISANGQLWTFNTVGNLVLPNANSSINYPNGTPYGGSGSGNGFSNGTSNGSIPVVDGNINFSVNGNTNILVVTGNGANVTGNFAVTGKTNLNAVGNVTITGGNTGQYLQTDGAGNLTWATVNSSGFSNGTSNGAIPVANGNVNFSASGNANILVVTGTGANITGTANVAGNFSVTGKTNLNAVGNITITGGSNTQYLQTDGAGNLSWATVNTAATGNGTSGLNVPVANGNVLIGSGNNPNAIVVGNTGSVVGGNLGATGNGNIGGNLGVGGGITATGNIQGNMILGNGALLTGIASISNGNSNIRIAENSNIAFSVSGNANIFTFTGASANFSKDVGLDSNLTVAGNTLFGSNVSMNAFNITNLAEPNVGTDAATKYYVDTYASGLSVKQSANAATPNTLANITGGTISYNNGTSGVGANLTVTGGTLTTIDGVSLTANMRLLIKNEANQAWNGIYVYNNNTVITRSTDFDTNAEVQSGTFLFVTSGTLLADTAWVQTTDGVVVGTSNISFSQFSGAGSFQANQGINLTGSTFSANTDGITTSVISGNIVVKPSANLTTPNIGDATGNSLTITGNGLISANTGTFSGNVTAGNLSVLAKSNLNSISNVIITGGTAGQFIKTDGNGNLSFGDGGQTPGSLTRYFTANSILVAPTTLDTFYSNVYRSVLYQLQISSGSDYEVTMISLLQNNTNVYISQFSDVTSNVPLASFDASLAANVVTVTFTPVNGVTAISGIAMYLSV
jgi:hypothetical protein